MKTLAFFNNKGGVGKTSLIYHLAWMYAEKGLSVLAVDLDPQSNLSAMFLTEEELAAQWDARSTVVAALEPLKKNAGDVAEVEPCSIRSDGRLHLIVGDLRLSRYEDLLAENWGKCLDGEEGPFRVISALYRMMQDAAQAVEASVILMDVGPNLGALNRAALLAADHIALPLAPDLFSLQGMRNLGPTLRDWRKGWKKRCDELEDAGEPIDFSLPPGHMSPLGYVVMNFGVRDQRPVQAYDQWLAEIPKSYHCDVLGEADGEPIPTTVEADPNFLAALKHYPSLMPMAMSARKPIFLLRSADGARGAHLDAVKRCYEDFSSLAGIIAERMGIEVP